MDAFCLIDIIAPLLPAEKNVKTKRPVKKYTGKFSILMEKIVEKMRVNITIVKSGLRKLQNIPSTDLRYFILISLFTNSFKR